VHRLLARQNLVLILGTAGGSKIGSFAFPDFHHELVHLDHRVDGPADWPHQFVQKIRPDIRRPLGKRLRQNFPAWKNLKC